MKEIERLASGERLSLEEWRALIADEESYPTAVLGEMAVSVRDAIYGRRVFIRGLIEFTSYCRNDCYYCGIRRSNGRAARYRMTPEAILDTCALGYARGFRTFVLQGGEDPYWSDDILSPLIMRIKESCPEAAVTLSLGERSDESYRRLREAGADRYLLRHETADSVHYGRLHPSSMSLDNRKRCLRTLKRLGYQTGAGMMIGSPFSSVDTLAADMAFLQELSPEMVGMGPLDGHILGFNAGANVVMPNITPEREREKYSLYDGKKITGDEDGSDLCPLFEGFRIAGYEASMERGDYL